MSDPSPVQIQDVVNIDNEIQPVSNIEKTNNPGIIDCLIEIKKIFYCSYVCELRTKKTLSTDNVSGLFT